MALSKGMQMVLMTLKGQPDDDNNIMDLEENSDSDILQYSDTNDIQDESEESDFDVDDNNNQLSAPSYIEKYGVTQWNMHLPSSKRKWRKQN